MSARQSIALGCALVAGLGAGWLLALPQRADPAPYGESTVVGVVSYADVLGRVPGEEPATRLSVMPQGYRNSEIDGYQSGWGESGTCEGFTCVQARVGDVIALTCPDPPLDEHGYGCRVDRLVDGGAPAPTTPQIYTGEVAP